jgi:hypothetical protein
VNSGTLELWNCGTYNGSVAQRQAQAGRPGSALLILGAIFATALFLRAPAGLGPAEPMATALDVETISIWSALPILPMHPPALEPATATVGAIVGGDKPSLSILAATLDTIETTQLASVSEMHQPEVDARRQDAVSQLLPVGPEPTLAATSHGYMSALANPVAPVSYVAESASGPFGAVGTAFVKTGAALSLAFKKTGQGILAPF